MRKWHRIGKWIAIRPWPPTLCVGERHFHHVWWGILLILTDLQDRRDWWADLFRRYDMLDK